MRDCDIVEVEGEGGVVSNDTIGLGGKEGGDLVSLSSGNSDCAMVLELDETESTYKSSLISGILGVSVESGLAKIKLSESESGLSLVELVSSESSAGTSQYIEGELMMKG